MLTVKYPLPIWTEQGQEILLINLDSDIALKLLDNQLLGRKLIWKN